MNNIIATARLAPGFNQIKQDIKMEATLTRKVLVNITMNQDEAEWLIGFIQSHPGDSREEPTTNALRQRELFETLRDCLK